MLSIRFNRTGKKNRATFRVVLQEKTQAPGRRHVELLGSYDPHSKEATLHGDRITYWIGEGAEVSDSVHNLLVREGVLRDGKKRAIKIPKPIAKEDEATPESTDAGKAGETETEGTDKKAEAKEELTEEKAGETSPESLEAGEKKEEKSE